MDRQLYGKLKSLGVDARLHSQVQGTGTGDNAEVPVFAEGYLEELSVFIEGFDFMRLGQAVSKGQWEAAMMALRRMDLKSKKLGIRCFEQPFVGLRQAILNRNVQQGKQAMAAVTTKRVRLREALKQA